MICSHTLGSRKNDLLAKITNITNKKSKQLNIKITIDNNILADVIQRWCDEIKKIETINQNINYVSPFRVSGFLTFWIRKLKPFSVIKYSDKDIEKQIYVNEIFALIIGLILLYGLLNDKKKINSGAFLRLLTSLRYNSMSPMSVALIYEYLYE